MKSVNMIFHFYGKYLCQAQLGRMSVEIFNFLSCSRHERKKKKQWRILLLTL